MSLESTVNEYDRSKLAVWDYPMGLYRYTRVILIDNIFQALNYTTHNIEVP